MVRLGSVCVYESVAGKLTLKVRLLVSKYDASKRAAMSSRNIVKLVTH